MLFFLLACSGLGLSFALCVWTKTIRVTKAGGGGTRDISNSLLQDFTKAISRRGGGDRQSHARSRCNGLTSKLADVRP